MQYVLQYKVKHFKMLKNIKMEAFFNRRFAVIGGYTRKTCVCHPIDRK